MTTDNIGNAMGMKAIKGRFYNLVVRATNKKTVLEKLAASNAKLAAKNEELVAVVKNLTNNKKDIQQ